MSATEVLDRSQAIAAAKAAAFTVGEGYEDEGRVIVHSILSGWLGADWDLDSVVDLIESAEEVWWQDGIGGHDLAVITRSADDRKLQYNFDVPRPSGATS